MMSVIVVDLGRCGLGGKHVRGSFGNVSTHLLSCEAGGNDVWFLLALGGPGIRFGRLLPILQGLDGLLNMKEGGVSVGGKVTDVDNGSGIGFDKVVKGRWFVGHQGRVLLVVVVLLMVVATIIIIIATFHSLCLRFCLSQDGQFVTAFVIL